MKTGWVVLVERVIPERDNTFWSTSAAFANLRDAANAARLAVASAVAFEHIGASNADWWSKGWRRASLKRWDNPMRTAAVIMRRLAKQEGGA